MSRNYIPVKENNWVDTNSSNYVEDECSKQHKINGYQHCVNSDSMFDIGEALATETGIRKEKQKIQKVSSYTAPNKNITIGKKMSFKRLIKERKKRNK